MLNRGYPIRIHVVTATMLNRENRNHGQDAGEHALLQATADPLPQVPIATTMMRKGLEWQIGVGP